MEIAVDLDVQCAPAAGAFRGDDEIEGFIPELPLHEGRRYRVLRSSGVYLFTAAEKDAVRCW